MASTGTVGMLTPGPSLDISGQKAGPQLSKLDASFALPPAALANGDGRSSSISTSSTSSKAASDSSYRPVSPLSPSATNKPAATAPTRKRSNIQRNSAPSDDYALPPPPTRTRKIIQMKPKGQETQETEKNGKTTSSKSSPGKATAQETDAATTTGAKRKASNGVTAVSRKVARKTAHSLIERRRRSKMNEEFSVLKDMIPACSGQEMHKLAILQASIEYMRYLEQCVSDLKTANKSRGSSLPESPHGLQPRQSGPPVLAPKPTEQQFEHDEESDEEMSEIGPSPSVGASNPPSTFSVVSPQIMGSAQTSPAFGAVSQHFSFRQPLTLPSPVFLAQQSPQHTRRDSNMHSPTTTLPSPALLPRADHEATAALMMLGTDRRNWEAKKSERTSTASSSGGRGMSVRDLLSSS